MATAVVITGMSVASAQDAKPAMEISGNVAAPLQLTATDLQGMVRSSVSIPNRSGDGIRRYEGVALWRLLDSVGVSTEKLNAKDIAKRYLTVRGADGFEVVFSLAELGRAYAEDEVILADRMDGQPLPASRGSFQIIVPGDLRPTRNCYQVIALTVHETNKGQ
ncbi:molybdopterin-dependent oxidoreductase [Parapedobacter koreensis]|nr:molybdopterin-dependent oxidoreductase [Parapedobacter koreensis]